jgi:2-methylcitrate dehydratase PrpD
VVATALVKGNVTIADFTDEAIRNKDILEISCKVTGYIDTSMNRRGVGPGKVTIIMKGGNEYTEEIEHALGSPQRPMTFDDCAKKLRECSTQSLRPLPLDMVDKLIDMVNKLEQLDDVADLIRIVS